ncbi:MAG TPA: hypothetical protein VGA37_08105 [Gemmatimonadales bacterium]
MRTIKLLTTTMLTMLALAAFSHAAEAQSSARARVTVRVVQVSLPMSLLASTVTELAAAPEPVTRHLPAGARARVTDSMVSPAATATLMPADPKAPVERVRTITFEYVAN